MMVNVLFSTTMVINKTWMLSMFHDFVSEYRKTGMRKVNNMETIEFAKAYYFWR